MKNQPATMLAAALALASVLALASGPRGPDVAPNGTVTPTECLALQAAKHDGSSGTDRKKACQWTTERSSPNDPSSSEKSRAVDSAPYGSPPGLESPPPR